MQQLAHFSGNRPVAFNGSKNPFMKPAKPQVAFKGAQHSHFGNNTGVLMPRFSGGMTMAGQNLNLLA